MVILSHNLDLQGQLSGNNLFEYQLGNEMPFKSGTPSSVLEITLAKYEPGVYLYSVTTDKSNISGKLIIQY